MKGSCSWKFWSIEGLLKQKIPCKIYPATMKVFYSMKVIMHKQIRQIVQRKDWGICAPDCPKKPKLPQLYVIVINQTTKFPMNKTVMTYTVFTKYLSINIIVKLNNTNVTILSLGNSKSIDNAYSEYSNFLG